MMTEERALMTRVPDLQAWQLIESIAPVALASRLFGVASQEQAALIMLKGYEFGLSLSASFEFIDVIDGKPAIKPKGMLALIHNSGQCGGLTVTDQTDDNGKPYACTVTMQRINGFEFTTRFTMNDAQNAGLIKSKGAWEKYPANMLRWRAIGYCADIVFPDLCGGMYRPEELGANVNADGEPIEAEYIVTTPAQPAPAPQTAVYTEPPIPTPEPAMTLADLLAQWPAHRIIEVYGGIPASAAQVAEAKEKLEQADASAS